MRYLTSKPCRWLGIASTMWLAFGQPCLAQLGQSELITPGATNDDSVSTSGQPLNPGKGWMPARRFQSETPTLAPVVQQQPMQMQSMPAQSIDGPQLGDDGSMPWQDARRAVAAPAQPMMAPTAAFQAPAPQQRGDAWTLPSAQQDLQWAQNLPDVPLSAVTPVAATAIPGAKPAAKPGPKAGGAAGHPVAKTASAKPTPKPAASQPGLSGYVTESASVPQPTSQFDPDAGFPAANGVQGLSAVQPGTGYGGMGQGMPQGMQAMQSMPQGMQQGFAAAQGGQQMGMQAPPAMMNGMGGMPGAGTGMPDMNALGGLGGLAQMAGMGGGTGGNPLDNIGKAIAGAAAMGLIPSASSGAMQPGMPPGYNPNAGMPVQMAQPQRQVRRQVRRPAPPNTLTRAVQNQAAYAVGRGMNNLMYMGLRGIRW